MAREAIEHYGDESAAQPVGTGSVSPQELHALLEDRARGESRLSRVDARRRSACRASAAVEISIMEETQSRWLAFQRGDTDIEYQLAEVAPTFITADGKLKPELAKRGIGSSAASTRRSSTSTSTCRTRPVGGLSKEKIALRRAIADGVQGRGPDPHHPQGPVDPRALSDPARRRGHDPDYRIEHLARSARGERAARQVRLQARAPTATGACRTASRSSSATRRRRASATGSSTS